MAPLESEAPTYLPSIEKQNSFVFTDNLTWIRGHHSLKFGTEVRIEQFTIFQPAESRGALDFGNEFTDNPAATGNWRQFLRDHVAGRCRWGWDYEPA